MPKPQNLTCPSYTRENKISQTWLSAGAVQRGRAGGPRPPAPALEILPPLWPPMKFMIKHNLPLVRGGSLWQYRSVAPSCNYGHPTAPPNVNPRTATDYQHSFNVLIFSFWGIPPLPLNHAEGATVPRPKTPLLSPRYWISKNTLMIWQVCLAVLSRQLFYLRNILFLRHAILSKVKYTKDKIGKYSHDTNRTWAAVN